MKDKDTKLIWEKYQPQLNESAEFARENLPQSGYTIPTGTGGRLTDSPDEKDPVRFAGHRQSTVDAYNQSQKSVELYGKYYHAVIDTHGGDQAARTYTGLTPQEGDSEALQFLNVLNYLLDTVTPEKLELITAALSDPSAHLDVAYALSEYTPEQLNGLTDGSTSLPF